MSTSQTLLLLAGVIVFSMVGSLIAIYIAPEILPEEPVIVEEKPELLFDMVGFDGKLVRLNRESGDLLVVDEKGISRFDQATMAHSKLVDFTYVDEEFPLGTKDGVFPESKGAFWQRIEYKLIGDQLKYKLEIGPYVEELYTALLQTTSSIRICFCDSDNFEVLNAIVLLKAPTRVSNDDGTVSHLIFEGEEECSKEIYEMVASVTVGWSYDDAFQTALKKSTDPARAIQDKQRKELQELFDNGVYTGSVSQNSAMLYDENRSLIMVPIRNWAGLIRVGNLKRLSEKLEAEVSTSPAENE